MKHRLEENPLSGHLYVFVNRQKTQMKIHCFDRNGYAIWSKRLEQGQFVVYSEGGIKRQIYFAQLQSLLEGIELENTRQYKRFSLPKRRVFSYNASYVLYLDFSR